LNRVADCHVRAEIAGRIGGIHSEHCGKGRTRGRCYLVGDEPALVVAILEGTFTPAEKTLIHHPHAPPAHRSTDPSTRDHTLDVPSTHK